MSKFLKKLKKYLKRAKADENHAEKWLRVQLLAVLLFPERFQGEPAVDVVCELLEELAATNTAVNGQVFDESSPYTEADQKMLTRRAKALYGPGTAAKEEYDRKLGWFNGLEKTLVGPICNGCGIICGPLQPIQPWIEAHYPHGVKNDASGATKPLACGEMYPNKAHLSDSPRLNPFVTCILPRGHEGCHETEALEWDNVQTNSD